MRSFMDRETSVGLACAIAISVAIGDARWEGTNVEFVTTPHSLAGWSLSTSNAIAASVTIGTSNQDRKCHSPNSRKTQGIWSQRLETRVEDDEAITVSPVSDSSHRVRRSGSVS